jgi:hypothetical protein
VGSSGGGRKQRKSKAIGSRPLIVPDDHAGIQ